MTADRVENGPDINEAESERAARDEISFWTRYPLDADFRWHAAPRERPCAARSIRRHREDAGCPRLQRLIRAIEKRTRTRRIGGRSIEERRLYGYKGGDVIEGCGDGIDF